MKIHHLQPGQEPASTIVQRGGGMDDGVKKIIIVGLLMVVLVAIGLWGCSAQRKAKAEAEAAQATPTVPMIQTVGPLPAVLPPTPIPQPPTPLEPAQIAGTATMQAALNRPAGNPANSPYLIGVITYEPGCVVSNFGFTTAGYEGVPYYLYPQTPLDRDPFMQMAQVRGYIQEFKECKYPVLMVSELVWLNGTATPAPIAQIISGTITGTVTTTNTWGLAAYGLSTPDGDATPVYDARFDPTSPQYILATQTAYPTYTPYPTPTLYIPPPRTDPYNPPDPTKTPKPSKTPTFTPTPTPTQAANLGGVVVSIGGCTATNMAIEITPGQTVPLLLSGAPLPVNGNPIGYYVLAAGVLEQVCGQSGLKASSISWYLNAPDFTPTPTSTLTPTGTPTPTETPTPTGTPTETLTPDPSTPTPDPPTPTPDPSTPPTAEPTEPPTP